MKKMFLVLASVVISLTACSKDSGGDDSPPIEKQLFNAVIKDGFKWGGDLANAKLVTDYNSFMEFLKKPAPEDLVKSCTPVGYRVKTIRDNRPIAVRTMYTEERFTYKK